MTHVASSCTITTTYAHATKLDAASDKMNVATATKLMSRYRKLLGDTYFVALATCKLSHFQMQIVAAKMEIA
jgi:hypothetical protein